MAQVSVLPVRSERKRILPWNWARSCASTGVVGVGVGVGASESAGMMMGMGVGVGGGTCVITTRFQGVGVGVPVVTAAAFCSWIMAAAVAALPGVGVA
ncbi:MAG: hypothetical protein DCC57_24510 [Chloroflexi bacterium]|nr:MAG: hypothetical protein DCC57_24510 [Chloroflexota bacterium]